MTLASNPSNGSAPVTLSASVTSSGSTVRAAEYFIDAIGADGSGCALAGLFGTASASVTATLPTAGASAPCVDLATLVSGSHTVAVHGQDASGAWGATASAALVLDRSGPSVSGVSITPAVTNGALDLALGATGSDAASGGGSVTAAEYSIDAGSATPISIATPATDVGLNATIGAATVAALAAGPHTISVHARDAAGNWGPMATTTFVIDRVAPTVSAVTLTPPASNNTPVAVSAAASDTATGNSNIAGGELFIDTAGATGTGTAMTAAAAAPSTTITGTISAARVAALSAGNHAIYVHARDAAGNWSSTATATLLIDRTPPTFSSITLTPSSVPAGTASVNLTANGAADPLVGGLASGVAGGEWWIGTSNITPGTGTAFSGLITSVATGALTPGTYTVRVRIRDAAGNWSTSPASGVRTATLTVTVPIPDAIFADGFETGTLSPLAGWTSRSTSTASRLTVGTPALVGAFSLQAQGNNTNYVQYNLAAAGQPAASTYDARFYVRPNGATSTGKDILSAATSSGFGTTLFRVRYRLNGTTPQIQIQVGTGNGNTTWTTILGGTSSTVIEVVWQSGTSLGLYINGTLSQTLTAGTGSVGAVRLGSVTATGSATLMSFDAFDSKRSPSPLVGP